MRKSNNRSKKGLSLINLIAIVVTVIIIAVIISIAKGTSSEEQFSKFQKDFKEYVKKIEQDFTSKKTDAPISMQNNSIYYSIANGVDVNGSSSITPTGTIEQLEINLKEGKLNGKEFYEIQKDTNVANVKKQNSFYQSDEKHYVSDAGDVFILPGYKMKQEDATNRWYITDTYYYESDVPINDFERIKVDNIKITSDTEGKLEAKTNLKKDAKVYITFDATLADTKANVSPKIPFEVTKNGTYNFTITANGKIKNTSVTVNNFRTQNPSDILKVGDYIDYTSDSGSYKTTKDKNGYSNQTLITENKKWRIIYIDKDTDNVYITPSGIVNNGISLSGINGYAKGVEELNTICKTLYSNQKLGLTARCMTVEDANKIFNKTVPEAKERYAYYPRGTSVNGTIDFENNTYIKTTNDWRTAKFYTSDGGGVENTDTDEIKYREPEVDNPVYVTQTFYSYTVDSTNSVLSNVLGKSISWLASQSVYASKTGAGFGMRTFTPSGINAEILYDSYANIYAKNLGLHPIVEIDSLKYSIDLTDKTRDGSNATKAWKIIKDN